MNTPNTKRRIQTVSPQDSHNDVLAYTVTYQHSKICRRSSSLIFNLKQAERIYDINEQLGRNPTICIMYIAGTY